MTFQITRKSDGKLARFASGLQAIADGRWKEPVMNVINDELRALVEEGFDKGIAPDGTPWLPTVAGNTPPLTQTRALRDSVQIVPGNDGISTAVRITDEKAEWHQFGTKRGGPTTDAKRAQNRKTSRGRGAHSERWHIVPRRMLPTIDNSVRWSLRIHKAAQAAFAATFDRLL